MNVELTTHERRTREILAAAEEERWTPERKQICFVFKTLYGSALARHRVEEVGAALTGERLPLQKELTKMVREGALRSRRQGGFTLYEVNY